MTSFHFKNPREHIGFAKNLRKEAPLTERLLWNALSEMKGQSGLKFRRQHPLHPYVADFACVRARLIIEIDGMSHDNQQGYDRTREAFFNKKGWKVVRFTNEEVLNNLEGVVLTVVKTAQELSASVGRDQPSPSPSRAREGDTTGPAKNES